MTDVTYTHSWETDNSSAVDNLYYDQNDNTLVIDWNDELYRYSGVTLAEAEAVSAGTGFNGSVGRAAARLKQNKGQGEYLGNWWNLEFQETAPTSYGRYKQPVSAGSVSTVTQPTATKEYSLTTPQAVATATEGKVTVFFTLQGDDVTHEYEAEGTDPSAAVEELNEVISRVKGKGKVKKVVIDFE